uniref:NADH-ubiquinone oxidoreductase chain 4L n=1 Tax=Paralepetopsis sp. TaxID=3071116 RepID=A0AA96KJM7_9GAST|nr:NADH dehydrogenase subunit 4l [Paralepetopsis sp.]
MQTNLHLLVMLPILSFTMATLSLTLQKKHILIILLLYETMMLGTLLLLTHSMALTLLTPTPIIIFLILAVCEASLGLSILVAIIRSNGNDYVSVTTMSKS